MIKQKKNKVCLTLYSLFIANYVLSESELVNYTVTNIVLAVSRYAIVALFALLMINKANFRITRRYFFSTCLFVLAVIINTLVCNGGLGIILLAIVIFSLHYNDIEIEPLIKATIKSLWISTLIVLLLCFAGFIPDSSGIRYVGSDIISFYDGSSYRNRYGFLAANLIPHNLYITYIYLIISKRGNIKLYVHFIVAILAFIFLFMFGSRMAFIMTFATILAYFVARIISKKRKEKKRKKRLCVLWLSYPFCFFVSLIASIKYNPFIYSWRILNNMLMNRLLMSKTGINTFGISLFGVGNNVYDLTVEGLRNATIDNGYVHLLLARGIIITIMIICVWSIVTYRAEQSGNFYLVFCLVALAFSNLIDEHLASYKMIPLFVLMFNQYSQVITMAPKSITNAIKIKGFRNI